MAHRAMCGDRVFEHINSIVARYDIDKIRFADDILPRPYFKTLLPKLAEAGHKIELSCEIKSNISFAEFSLLRQAGFSEVQPGIESFSTDVLKNINKGVSAIRNIATLKFGKENGVQVHYNILYGFPSDEMKFYEEMIKTIPCLYHLDPPYSYGNVLLCRFAPMQTMPGRFGIANVDFASDEYNVVFSRKFMESNQFEMKNYCYYFSRTYEIPAELQELFAVVDIQVEHWQSAHRGTPPELFYEIVTGGIRFHDSRHTSAPVCVERGADVADVYRAISNEIMTIEKLIQSLKGQVGAHDVIEIVNDLVSLRVAYREGNQLLGLALKKSHVVPPEREPSNLQQYDAKEMI